VVDVLVVGAGPAGLTAAIELARRGVSCAIVDRRAEPRPGTRGCTVWQRTLEIFDLMGLPVSRYQQDSVAFQHRVYHVVDLDPIAIGMVQPSSRYPLPLLVGQQVTEAMLTGHLARLGVEIRRGVSAVSVAEDPAGVRVGLRGADGVDQTAWASWVVVAEGSHSTLRDELGIAWDTKNFPGAQLLQVDAFVDGDMPGSPEDAHLFLDFGGTLGSLPLPDGRRRLFLSVPDPDSSVTGDPSVAEIEPMVQRFARRPGLRLAAGRFNWRVRFHNSISETFRSGRCLLVGDSARTFMPVAAQGMNTGIQDAFNLGWKLAAVMAGKAGEELLASYCAERRPVAVQQLERAEKGLWGGVGTAPPLDDVIAGIHRQRTTRTALTLSYADGPLAEDRLGTPGATAGDRAPVMEIVSGGRPRPLHRPLRHGGWTLLVFAPDDVAGRSQAGRSQAGRSQGGRSSGWRSSGWLTEAEQVCPGPLRVLLMGQADLGRPMEADRVADPEGAARAAYGAETGALCLIRPDGYVGFRGGMDTGPELLGYLRRIAA